MRKLIFSLTTFVSCGVGAIPIIDDTPTRVQTTLDPGLRQIGTLRPKSVGQISSSRWTIDCAGMDRENVDWRAIREYVAPLGISRMRQQAGWARCEKDPGIYDFAWLDQAVLDAKAMGIDTWLEFSYGNPRYPGGGGRQLSAGFPTSEEALAAWDRWVEATVKHYKGIIHDFCIWNEPDLNRENDPLFVVQFVIRTAEIVKRIEPEARIAAFALCTANRRFVEPLVKELARIGKQRLFTSIAYHHYSDNPDNGYEQIESCKRLIAQYVPGLKMMEGEGGTQSEWGRSGALSGIHWTELTQAKYNLRRSLGDLGHGDDTEVFHMCDLNYRTSGFHDGLVRYGLLKTAGQAKSYRIYKVKMSYYAIQNAVSVFNDAVECLGPKTTSTVSNPERTFVCDWVDRKTGTTLALFWDMAGRPLDENATRTVTLNIKSKPFEHPVWVDVLTGNAYEIPSEKVCAHGEDSIYNVPCYDSPVFVTDRSILDLDASWFVREGSPVVITAAPKGMRPFCSATVYGPIDMSGKPFLTTEQAISKSCGAGRLLTAKDARFQLLSPDVYDLGVEPGNYFVFKIWSRQAQPVLFCWRNDYFGALAINGMVVDANLKGPSLKWGTKSLEFREGENEIVFRTSPGASGKWYVDAGVVDETGELKFQ